MGITRVARWAWPLVFLVPLTLVAGRGCQIPGVDPAYHLVLWMHENLPLLYLAAALTAALAVALRVARARARAATLFALETAPPALVESAFRAAAAAVEIGVPRVVYLDVTIPLCFALVGLQPVIVLSRGFIQDLDADQVGMVARHELLHVKHRDPVRGFAWHLAFAALLLPAFSALEQRLALRRELRTNLDAAAEQPERYAALLVSRARERRGLCTEAFGTAGSRRGIFIALAPPVFVFAVLAGLAVSHAWFMEHVAFLSTHHC
ncbi:MAG TPA: M48 family metalloprotease [Candidatus Elarobacter sp.]